MNAMRQIVCTQEFLCIKTLKHIAVYNALLNRFWTIKFQKKCTLLLVFTIVIVYILFTFIFEDKYKSHWDNSKIDYKNAVSKAARRTTSNKNENITCNFPVLNPFDPKVLPFIQPTEPVNCEKDHPQIFTTDLKSNLVVLKNPGIYGYLVCCYSGFERWGSGDFKIKLGTKCTPIISKTTKIPTNIEFIKVFCLKTEPGNDGIATQVPVDLFRFVHIKPEVEERVAEFERRHFKAEGRLVESLVPGKGEGNYKARNLPKKVNVVILGLDATSHMNFIRQMPATYEFITKNLSSVGMQEFMKIGENTFPNMIPMLVGQTAEEFQSGCAHRSMESCPFIWKEYASSGYRTAFGEDVIFLTPLNYAGGGFSKDPTDYYNNILLNQFEEDVIHQHLGDLMICYGSQLGFEISLDFIRKMAFTMGKSRRYFQFLWTTSMTHEKLGASRLGDKPLLELLQWFQKGGYFEHTVFILVSDHGMRWGGIRRTLQGRIEDRMPLLYFILPKWFKNQHSLAVRNLVENQIRLTTPFDLHETLLDLLNLNKITNIQIQKRRKTTFGNLNSPRGISLFLPVPIRRTCDDAGINEHWCICKSFKSVENPENHPLLLEAAIVVVEKINQLLLGLTQCSPLTLGRVLNAQILDDTSTSKSISGSSRNLSNNSKDVLTAQAITFTLAIEVMPSKGIFEATTTRRENGHKWEVSKEIDRANQYGNDARCLDDYSLKKFCFCS